MALDYTTVDGWPVAPNTAQAFLTRLKPAFERAFPGVTLHVYSGYRSYEGQVEIFKKRYVLWGDVGGRKVYDTRFWEGSWWYRIDPAGTVAQPGTSNHQSGHALDIRDSGSDAGVTTAGNARANWIRANADKYGFSPIGYTFDEPWHIELVGDPWAGETTTGAGGTAAPAENEEEWLMAAADDVAWIKDRLGGSVKSGTVTDEIRQLQADVAWLKDQVGGSSSRKTSLRQDVDKLLKG